MNDANANSLVNEFVKRYGEYLSQRSSFPEGVEIYHGIDNFGNHLYYFTPMASQIAEELLRRFNAIPCQQEPHFTGCRKVQGI